MHTRVKICGITNSGDVDLAVKAGADALGFNMFKGSARYVEPAAARELVKRVPPFVTKVGLFVNEEKTRVEEIDTLVDFDLLQFHGDESDEYCRQFEKSYMKVIRVKPGLDLTHEVKRYPGSSAILLDAYVQEEFGGTGKTINWHEIPDLNCPVILAGGLNPGNVIQAIALVKPFAVDVSSGVESSKGIKDSKKIRNFMAAVAAADESG